jgi:ADP-ribose pyrophosphatase YjhB (NUDIX family)
MNGTRIAQLADELRALAANGIHYHLNEYDLGRYQHIQRIAAQLFALADPRGADEIERVFRGDLDVRTPLVAADAAVFHPDGRLLVVQRADSGLWCMPGGAADIGESAAAAAQREAFEESGYIVRARRLLGVYDNRAWHGDPEAARHIYHVVFQCELVGGEATPSSESSEVRWVSAVEAATLPLFRSHARKVPAAFRLYADPGAPAEFD